MERLTTRYGGNAVMAWEQEGKYTTTEWIDMLTDRLCAYEDTMPLERAQQLFEADMDGRLMVMPVKEGTKIYRLGYRLGGKYEIEERYFNLTYYRDEILGKTIFLTREEAEAALKNKTGENKNG